MVLSCVIFWVINLKFARESRRRERETCARGRTTKARHFTRTSLPINVHSSVDTWVRGRVYNQLKSIRD